MIQRERRTNRAVAAFLVFAIIQLYVQASSIGVKVYAQDSARTAQSSGILTTTGNRNIRADKNDVNTGATILDGMTLETSDCVAATVRWAALDEVTLGTNTIAVVTHSEGKTRVVLRQGCAIVRGGQDDELIIETPDGKTTTPAQTDGAGRKSAQACFPSGARSDFNPSCLPPVVLEGTPSNSGWIVAGVVGAAALLVAIVLVNEGGDNPSPIAPS